MNQNSWSGRVFCSFSPEVSRWHVHEACIHITAPHLIRDDRSCCERCIGLVLALSSSLGEILQISVVSPGSESARNKQLRRLTEIVSWTKWRGISLCSWSAESASPQDFVLPGEKNLGTKRGHVWAIWEVNLGTFRGTCVYCAIFIGILWCTLEPLRSMHTEMNTLWARTHSEQEHNPELKTVWLWFGDYAVVPDRVCGKIN